MALLTENLVSIPVAVDTEYASAEATPEERIDLVDLRNLSVLNASSLQDRNSPIALERDANGVGIRLLDLGRVASMLRRQGKWGAVLDNRRVFRRMPVIAAAAPEAVSAKTTASYDTTSRSESGLQLKLGGLGVGRRTKFHIKESLQVECAAGEAKVGFLRIPLEKVTRQWRPPGAAEWFPITTYEPVTDIEHVGAGAEASSFEEILEGAVDQPIAVGTGDASFSSETSRQAEVSTTVELGMKWAGKTNELSISAELSGSIEIRCAYALPGGSFLLHWLEAPAGACVTPGE